MDGVAGPRILGYADRMSAAPGETLRFMVSCEGHDRYRADLVKLIHGYNDPEGPGFKEQVIDHPAAGERPGRYQRARSGSHVRVDGAAGPDLDGAVTVHAFIWPTLPDRGIQGIVTRWSDDGADGWGLFIDEDGCLALWAAAGGSVTRLSTGQKLRRRTWYAVAATLDGSRGTLYQRPLVASANGLLGALAEPAEDADADGHLALPDGPIEAPLLIAAHWSAEGATGHYDGKIEHPRIVGRALDATELDAVTSDPFRTVPETLAEWDFGAEIGPRGVPALRVTDMSGHGLDGECVNLPARGMTGYLWDGSEERYVYAPRHYGAIHFHSDDVEDVGWDVDLELTIPDDLRSGVYALRLRVGDGADHEEDHVPFFVRPRPGTSSAKIVFLVPTASYLAYSNAMSAFDSAESQSIIGHTPVLQRGDVYGWEHPEIGYSAYDLHSDGSGICYTSARRPILNMRPRYKSYTGSSLWQFPGDLCLIDWLEEKGYEYDVVTDQDLHREGADLLRPYRVVLTGSHPEYTSAPMLDAIETYVAGGGRLMYLGANGFYWIVSFHPERPHVMEVRRAESGSRAWQAAPGEYYLATTGERSGLWRNRGRAPQKMVGVGFTAEGMDSSSPYQRLPDSHREEARFIFEGVGDEPIGDFGLVGGGASGLEIDRYDLALGTPPHALLLATSAGFHTDAYQHVVEEIMFMIPGLGGSEDYQVRADMTYFTTPGGGGVFSTSSIAWSGSLAHNGYDNNVSRITANVIDRFCQDEPLTPTNPPTASDEVT